MVVAEACLIGAAVDVKVEMLMWNEMKEGGQGWSEMAAVTEVRRL